MLWAIFDYKPLVENLDKPAMGFNPPPYTLKPEFGGGEVYCVYCAGPGSETAIETFSTGQAAQAWLYENTVQPEVWEL